jgi:hypothetical protein
MEFINLNKGEEKKHNSRGNVFNTHLSALITRKEGKLINDECKEKKNYRAKSRVYE